MHIHAVEGASRHELQQTMLSILTSEPKEPIKVKHAWTCRATLIVWIAIVIPLAVVVIYAAAHVAGLLSHS